MIPIVILLLWVAASALIFYAWARRRKLRNLGATLLKADSTQAETCLSHGGICCGLHAVCEKGLPKRSEDLYFDDEELDRFTGRSPETYSDEEATEFRHIMLTTLPHELLTWANCLGKRGIMLPPSVRDEMLTIVSRNNS